MADCCPPWTRAQQKGTDNEGYGALLYHRDDDDENYPNAWQIGDAWLAPVLFCPWCGAPKDPEGRDETLPAIATTGGRA